MEELRIEIWDLLFRSGHPVSIDGIAQQIEKEADTVRQAVDHEWFTTADNRVAISQTSGTG